MCRPRCWATFRADMQPHCGGPCNIVLNWLSNRPSRSTEPHQIWLKHSITCREKSLSRWHNAWGSTPKSSELGRLPQSNWSDISLSANPHPLRSRQPQGLSKVVGCQSCQWFWSTPWSMHTSGVSIRTQCLPHMLTTMNCSRIVYPRPQLPYSPCRGFVRCWTFSLMPRKQSDGHVQQMAGSNLGMGMKHPLKQFATLGHTCNSMPVKPTQL